MIYLCTFLYIMINMGVGNNTVDLQHMQTIPRMSESIAQCHHIRMWSNDNISVPEFVTTTVVDFKPK